MPEVKQSWFNRKNVDYETPDYIFKPLDDEFGFTLDVCASKENTKCHRYFTKLDNGLEQQWAGEICWMNPPFGREMKRWIIKAYQESLLGAVVVALLPSRTNTAWWHDYVEKGMVRFIRGEVKFKGYERGLWMPMCIVIWKGGEVTNV